MEANSQLEATIVYADKIRAAIEALSEDDLYVLKRAADTCLFATEFCEPGEIIHEAMLRALSGSRQWPYQRVPFVVFLIMTMRSIADASRNSPEQARTESIDAFVLEAGHSVGSSTVVTTASPEEVQIESEHEAERQRNAAMDIEKLSRHFEKDLRVRLLISYLKNETSAREVCAELRWTKTEYATTRKRLRRAVERLFRTRKKS